MESKKIEKYIPKLTIYMIVMVFITIVSSNGAYALDKSVNSYEVLLKSRQFTPDEGWAEEISALTSSVTASQRVHVLIQFRSKLDTASRKALSEAGIKLLGYIPHNSWFASIPVSLDHDLPVLSMVRWIGKILPEDKLSQALLGDDRRLEEGGKIKINVIYFRDTDTRTLRNRLEALSAKVINEDPLLKSITVSVKPGKIQSLANDDAVRWVEPAGSGGEAESDRVRTHIQVDQVQGMDLTGDGIRVGIFEDHHAFRDHPDFGTRVKTPDGTGGYDPARHTTSVAGIIGGSGSQSVLEFGTPYQWIGMAPKVEMYSFDFTNGTDFGRDLADAVAYHEIDVANNSWGDSSCDTYGKYLTYSAFLDDVVHGEHNAPFGGRLPLVFSVGNDRDGRGKNNILDCSVFKDKVLPFENYGTLNQPKTAKNIITVGAVDSTNNAMTPYSSWGPTADGRIKPDIVASGHHDGSIESDVSKQNNDSCRFGGVGYIVPTYDSEYPKVGTHKGENGTDFMKDPELFPAPIDNSNTNRFKGYILTNEDAGKSCLVKMNSRLGKLYCDLKHNITWNTGDKYTIDRKYGCFGQTSNAAAATTGAIALLLEEYYKTHTNAPLSSTIKGLLIHTAKDLDDSTSWYNRGPDYASGFGLLQIKNAIEHMKNQSFLEDKIFSSRQTPPPSRDYAFTVEPGTPNVKVTLVWDDEPAVSNASYTLVSDLDLLLRDPHGNYHYPWTLDPNDPKKAAIRTKEDHINNVEQVMVDNPVPGTWIASVIGSEINDVDGYQEFSLVGPDFTPTFYCDRATELKEIVPYSGDTTYGDSNVIHYDANFLLGMDGPEKVHTVTTTQPGDLYVRLTDSTGDLWVFLLNDCDPRTTVNWVHNTESYPIAVYKNAPSGTHYIVVDSSKDQNGTYTLTASLNDSDFDGIKNSIDTLPDTFSNYFNNGTDNGKITKRGSQYLTIKNAFRSNDHKVTIKADESGVGNREQDAIVEACYKNVEEYALPLAHYRLSPGDEEEVICGSVTTTVLNGLVEITFFGDNGKTAKTSLPAGNTLIFDETVFSLDAPETNTAPVTVIAGGREIMIDPGDSINVFEQAIVNIKPKTLKLKRKGKWITAFIKLPEGYPLEDIDRQTVMLNDTVPAEKFFIKGKRVVVKFRRKIVIDLIEEMELALPANVDLSIALQNNDGAIFEGKDTVRVLNHKSRKRKRNMHR